MTQLFLSFFAAIGIVLLTVRVLDYFFYRKKRFDLPVILDFTNSTESEMVEILELIATLENNSCGKAAIGTLLCFVRNYDDDSAEHLRFYLEIYRLNGIIFEAESFPVDF